MVTNDIILVFLIRAEVEGGVSPLLPTAAESYNNQYEIPAEYAPLLRDSPSLYLPSSNKLIRSIGHSAPSRRLAY